MTGAGRIRRLLAEADNPPVLGEFRVFLGAVSEREHPHAAAYVDRAGARHRRARTGAQVRRGCGAQT
jgi:hypothetical protein